MLGRGLDRQYTRQADTQGARRLCRLEVSCVQAVKGRRLREFSVAAMVREVNRHNQRSWVSWELVCEPWNLEPVRAAQVGQ